MEYEIGSTGTYIEDSILNKHKAFRIADIHEAAAIAWLQAVCPDTKMGVSKKASELTIENLDSSWLNKLFVIVGEDMYGDLIALYSHDTGISLYRVELIRIKPTKSE